MQREWLYKERTAGNYTGELGGVIGLTTKVRGMHWNDIPTIIHSAFAQGDYRIGGLQLRSLMHQPFEKLNPQNKDGSISRTILVQG